jgi:hypothetical protein
MGMPITPQSLGYLKGVFTDEEFENLTLTEYRDSGTSTVKLSGPGVETKKKEIENAFMTWYPPQGYDSRVTEANNPTRGFVLVLNRFLSCD